MAGFRTEYEQKKWDSLEAEQNFPFKKMLSGIATPEDLRRAQTLLAKYNKLAADVFNMGLQAMTKVASDKVEKISKRASRSGRPLGRVALENLYTRVLQKEQAKHLPEIAKTVKEILDENKNQFQTFMEKVLPPREEVKKEETSVQKTVNSIPALLNKEFNKNNDQLKKINDSLIQSTRDLVNKSKELEDVVGTDFNLDSKETLASIDTTKIDTIALSEKDSDKVALLLDGMKRRQDSFYANIEAAVADKKARDTKEKVDQDFQKWLAKDEALKHKLEKEREQNSMTARLQRVRERFDKAKRGVGAVGRFMRGLTGLMLKGLVGIGATLLASEFFPKFKEMLKPENIAEVGKKVMDSAVWGMSKLKDEILPNFGSWVSETFTKLWPVIAKGASEVYQVLRTNPDGSLNLFGRLDAIANMDASKEKRASYAANEVLNSFGYGKQRRGAYEIASDIGEARGKVQRIEDAITAIQSGKRGQVDFSTLGIPGMKKDALPNMRGLREEINRTNKRIKELEEERRLSETLDWTYAPRGSSVSVSPVVTSNENYSLSGSPSLQGFSNKSTTKVEEEPTTILDLPASIPPGSPLVDPGYQLPRQPASVLETSQIQGPNIPRFASLDLAIINTSLV